MSITAAALKVFGAVAPRMPPALRAALWADAGERCGVARVRGLGWALAPPSSDPQRLHADLWGQPESHPKRSRLRFPHLLWKPCQRRKCTTQVVQRGFSGGEVRPAHYALLVQVAAPAVIVDSEILHRGGATPPAPPPPAAPPTAGGMGVGVGMGMGGGGAHLDVDLAPRLALGAGWVSSCSVELCSAAGWEAWCAGTGGTSPDDPHDEAYRMLPIAP